MSELPSFSNLLPFQLNDIGKSLSYVCSTSISGGERQTDEKRVRRKNRSAHKLISFQCTKTVAKTLNEAVRCTNENGFVKNRFEN